MVVWYHTLNRGKRKYLHLSACGLVIISTHLCVEIGVNDLGWEALIIFLYTIIYKTLDPKFHSLC
ncbi:MAG: hypothetical protein CL916_04780 [Deltaproteobacteria bacterium]|nr:hypothetical protein [Deltaproteobacteria bacterium]